jgi:hypothetical protein
VLLALVPAISQEARAMLRALTDVDGHLAAVYANGLVRLSNLLRLGGLLPRLATDGGR